MSGNIPKRHYGAAGVGSSSRFDVAIDEAVDDANHLQMSIEARGWSFRFALSTRDDAALMLSFLREHTGRVAFAEVVVGSFLGTPVSLIKDDEFSDRFYLRAFAGDQLLSFVLAADDLTGFADALAQAVQDLQS